LFTLTSDSAVHAQARDLVTPEVERLLAELGYEPPLECEPASQWVGGELRYVRRAAQAEAERAYGAWLNDPSLTTYAAYRAAQDRADAAQDHLAQWLARSATG
jgi:hypothetical protein